MDESPGRERKPGGTVEPASRAPVAKQLFQTPEAPAAERYELRDPFAEVTYRTRTLDEIISKADQLGATRFVVVALDGKRTPVFKVAGKWARPDAPELNTQPSPRGDPQRIANVLPLIAAAPPVQAVVAKIDAEAEREARVARLEAALNERYIVKRASIKIGDVTIGQTEYRHRGDATRVAFTESAFRLATETNSPSVARSMLDVAEARNWQSLRVSGNEDFKRLVWLEASLRNVKTVGYEPVPGDQELLRKEREVRLVNRIEPLPTPAGAAASTAPGKASARGSGGRKTILAALEAVLIAQRVPQKQREAVMAAAAENLARRLRNGEVHKVKVYDKAAPSQRPVVAPTREVQRTRERPAPGR